MFHDGISVLFSDRHDGRFFSGLEIGDIFRERTGFPTGDVSRFQSGNKLPHSESGTGTYRDPERRETRRNPKYFKAVRDAPHSKRAGGAALPKCSHVYG